MSSVAFVSNLLRMYWTIGRIQYVAVLTATHEHTIMCRHQCSFALAALACCLTTIACAEVRVEGSLTAARVITDQESIADVLSAFKNRRTQREHIWSALPSIADISAAPLTALGFRHSPTAAKLARDTTPQCRKITHKSTLAYRRSVWNNTHMAASRPSALCT